MKTIFILLVVLVSSSALYAQKDEEAVAKAVETLKQAMLDANKQALEKIASDNLTYGHSGGLIEDKAAFVEALVSGKSDFQSIEISEQKIVITGNAATVRHKLAGDVTNSGTPSKLNLSVLLVWVKINNEWKLLARQAVRLTAP
jgi:hypothetical protein